MVKRFIYRKVLDNNSVCLMAIQGAELLFVTRNDKTENISNVNYKLEKYIRLQSNMRD